MAAGGAGYFNGSYFSDSYWHLDYWAEGGVAPPITPTPLTLCTMGCGRIIVPFFYLGRFYGN
jgi:hypothetical protein